MLLICKLICFYRHCFFSCFNPINALLPSYRNQLSIDLLCKSIDWFLYTGNTGIEWVNMVILLFKCENVFVIIFSLGRWNPPLSLFSVCILQIKKYFKKSNWINSLKQTKLPLVSFFAHYTKFIFVKLNEL